VPTRSRLQFPVEFADRTAVVLHRVREEFRDVALAAKPPRGVDAGARKRREWNTRSDHRFRERSGALHVHVTHGAELTAVGHEEVDLVDGLTIVAQPCRSPSEAMAAAGLHARHHRVRSTEQDRRLHRLLTGGLAGEEEDDPRQGVLPRPAVKAAVVDGAFRNAGGNELLGRRDSVWEDGSQPRDIHWEMLTGRRRAAGRFGETHCRKATFMPSACMKVALLQLGPARRRAAGARARL
jgi:hypothetical protein